MLGGYTINASTSGMPQKVATGFAKVFEHMVGASYTPIAYLGSKVVNGTNHAILASQTLVTGKDVHSIVLIVLNEKPGDVDGSNFSIVEIRTLLSDGGKMGGLSISPATDIPADAMEVFNKHFAGFLGGKYKALALLATQVVHGVAYVFAAETTIMGNPTSMKVSQDRSIVLVKLYSDYSSIETTEVISGNAPENAAGVLGSPLGEWP